MAETIHKIAMMCLQPSIPALVGAITFAVIASSLEAHVREATHRMWALPTQLRAGQPPASPGAGAGSMRVQGMWPYWLDCRSPKTVRNDIDLASMVILTGRLLGVVASLRLT